MRKMRGSLYCYMRDGRHPCIYLAWHSLSSKLCKVLFSHCLSQNPLKLQIGLSLSQKIPLKLEFSLNTFRISVFSSFEKCPSCGFMALQRKSNMYSCTDNAKGLLYRKLIRDIPTLHLSNQSTWIK